MSTVGGHTFFDRDGSTFIITNHDYYISEKSQNVHLRSLATPLVTMYGMRNQELTCCKTYNRDWRIPEARDQFFLEVFKL